MNDHRAPSLKKWPFYAADLVLLGAAFWLVSHYPHPLPLGAAILVTACVALAAVLGVMPHRMEYEAATRLAESDGLTDAVEQIKKTEIVADQIRAATGQWQGVQEHSARTLTAAKDISERMATEARAFTEFMQKANDSEKATLRLEVDKLRRGESQWLQVLVHLMDHVFALHQAGARSGQPNLEAQLGRFQEACREVVRRVGLTPVEAAPDEPYEADRHQLVDGQPTPEADARIADTLAAGYTFQGQLVRKPMVSLRSPESAAPAPDESTALAPVQEETSSPSSQSPELLSETEAPAGNDEPAGLEADQSFRLEADPVSSSDKERLA